MKCGQTEHHHHLAVDLQLRSETFQDSQHHFVQIVRDKTEAIVGAVRRFLKSGTNRILMQDDIWNAYGSINWLSVLGAVRNHVPGLVPLSASPIVEIWDCSCDTRTGRDTARRVTSTTVLLWVSGKGSR